MSTLSMNREKYLKLKTEYNSALTQEKKSFIFYGSELLTSYAKYLLEYLSGIYEPKKN